MVEDGDIKFVIRDACLQDIDDIFRLSRSLNSLNLPADRTALEQVLMASENSFSLEEKDANSRQFLFVLTESMDRVIGSSQIFAKHGTLASPHHYFQVAVDERYSSTLKKYFRHPTLRLCQSFDGPTEIGSLVLQNEYRSGKAKLGILLSYVRFLFMAIKPDFFCQRVLAELLPPLGPNFESPLWDAVGRKFTGLDYYEADMLSRDNKEFIKTLFPQCEIYVSLLPKSAQEVIGRVGHNSKGAAHLLSKIGFRYSERVDPFDGGPHFEAEQKQISLVQQSVYGRARVLKRTPEAGSQRGICGRFLPQRPSGERMMAVVARFVFDREQQYLHVEPKALRALRMEENGELWAVTID